MSNSLLFMMCVFYRSYTALWAWPKNCKFLTGVYILQLIARGGIKCPERGKRNETKNISLSYKPSIFTHIHICDCIKNIKKQTPGPSGPHKSKKLFTEST